MIIKHYLYNLVNVNFKDYYKENLKIIFISYKMHLYSQLKNFSQLIN